MGMFEQSHGFGRDTLGKVRKKRVLTPNHNSTRLILVITGATGLLSETKEPGEKEKVFHNPLTKRKLCHH